MKLKLSCDIDHCRKAFLLVKPPGKWEKCYKQLCLVRYACMFAGERDGLDSLESTRSASGRVPID